jgi:hypothetical protein
LTAKVFHRTIAPEVLLAARAAGALSYLCKGNRSRRENFDADEEEGKEKEETLNEAVPRVGP